jgi:DNA gyrase/topoisomerase IV subunit A
MKLQLGYRLRDCLYYKRRSGNNAATLHEIEDDDDANAMIAYNEEERQVRLLLSNEQKIDKNVNITPLKVPGRRPIREENIDDDEEFVDAYKQWMHVMHKENRFTGKCYVELLYV